MSDGNTVSQNVETQTVLDNNIEIQVAQEVQEQITVGVPGPRGPVGPMGSGVAWRGAYDPTTDYELHDAVGYLGSSYACFAPCTGITPTETSNWELVAAKGDTGADGVSDIPGPRGYDGTPGSKGDTGITGAPGEQGVQGIQGIQGSQGETGVQGIQGVKGDDSTVAGPKGDTGTAGSAGADGIDGITPIKGVDYFDGVDGLQGIQGIQGETGPAGPKGDKGDTGSTGAAGTTTWAGITDKPALGTAAAKNIPATGNATVTEVVYGSDTRLTDARTPVAHNQALATISDVTCTAAEINKLAGLATTAAELSYVHGVTSAIQTQLAAKAPLASPTFTGIPTAPTAAVDTDTTQLATTAMVVAQAASATPLIDATTAVVGTSTRFARGDHVHPTDTSRVAGPASSVAGHFATYADTTGKVIQDSGMDSNTLLLLSLAVARNGVLTNLITNGNFETNTAGWGGAATITRDTATPLVGTGSLKMVSAGGACSATFNVPSGFVVGHTYFLGGLMKTTAAAGRKAQMAIWMNGAWIAGTLVDCSGAAQRAFLAFTATATGMGLYCALDSYIIGESFLADTVVCYDLTA